MKPGFLCRETVLSPHTCVGSTLPTDLHLPSSQTWTAAGHSLRQTPAPATTMETHHPPKGTGDCRQMLSIFLRLPVSKLQEHTGTAETPLRVSLSRVNQLVGKIPCMHAALCLSSESLMALTPNSGYAMTT